MKFIVNTFGIFLVFAPALVNYFKRILEVSKIGTFR